MSSFLRDVLRLDSDSPAVLGEAGTDVFPGYEPSLDEMFEDPIVQARMAAAGVSVGDMLRLALDYRRHLRAKSPPQEKIFKKGFA